MRSVLLRCLAAAALIAPIQAWAALSCTTSAQAVAFGNYDPLSSLPTDSTGQVSVTCTNLVNLLVSYTVALSTGVSGSYSNRQLASGSNRLNYNLYTDLTHLLVWGDGTSGTSTVSNTFLVVLAGITANHTVYGRIPARQNVAVGSYSDTITVTVTY
jgi:spore coat protein U-like protein